MTAKPATAPPTRAQAAAKGASNSASSGSAMQNPNTAAHSGK